MANNPKTVDEYIADAPAEQQAKLTALRELIRKTAPDSAEKISYGIPYYSLNGRLVYFGYFKNHINLTVMASGIDHFAKDLKGYSFGKGSIQFPNDRPLPIELIKKVIKYRTAEQLGKKLN